MSEKEADELAVGAGVEASIGRAIWVLTLGWPEYFVSCLTAARSGEITSPAQARDHLVRGPHVTGLIGRCLGQLDSGDRSVVAQLAHLERCSPQMLQVTMSDGAEARLRTAGLPMRKTSSGWLEIAEPIRSELRLAAALSADLAGSLAPLVASEAGVVAGAKLLIAAGHPTAAAKMVTSVPAYQIDECSQSDLSTSLRTLLYTEKDDGSLTVLLARVLHNQGDLDGQRQALEEAAVLARDQLRPDLEVEANAELLMLDVVRLPADEARSRVESLRKQARLHATPSVQTRLREVEALLIAESGELSGSYQSVDQMRSVAEEWEVSGERARAAATLRLLAATGYLDLGRYTDGIGAMRRAQELSASHPQSLAKSVELLARLAALAGDIETYEEANADAEQLLEGLGLAWAEAYLAWSAMIAAGFVTDVDLVRHNHRKAAALLGGLSDHPTGVVFASESATSYAMAGDVDTAASLLDEVRRRRAESPVEFGFADVTVASRSGRAELVGVRVEELRASGRVPMERDWRLDLEQLIAVATSTGRVDVARYHDIQHEAQRHSLDTLFRAIVRTSPVVAALEHDVFVTALGGFVVRRQGCEVDLPEGRPSELIKLLAVRGSRVPLDVVIDHLWPDVSTAVGARRLKNVVNRVRQALGPESIDRTSGRIGLGSTVHTDLKAFRALLDADERSVPAARQALALYAGPLLELDLYADWVATEREAIRGRALAAFRTVLYGDEVSAVWALQALRRISPDFEAPYVEVAELALRTHDELTLREAVRVGADLCEELGVTPSPRLVELLAEVGSLG